MLWLFVGPSRVLFWCEGDEDGGILGYTNGFTIPFAAYMHCETLQVFSERYLKSYFEFLGDAEDIPQENVK